MEHIIGFSAQNISQPACHAGAEIQAERPEDDSDTASHVFAAVLADAFDNGKRTTVADSETLSTASGNKELTGGGAIEHGVSGKNVTAPGSGKSSSDGDGAAGKTFSHVIVGFALEPEGYALGKKSAEALARRAMKILPDLFIAGKAVLAPTHQLPAQPGADAAIRVLNRLRLILEPERGMEMKRFFERADMQGRLLLWRDAIRGRNRHDQERIHPRAGTQAVVPPGELAERTDAKLGEPIADFLGKRTEVGNDHLGLALKSGAQLFVLRGDAHRAS